MSDKPKYRINLDDCPVIDIKVEPPNKPIPFRAKQIHGTESSVMIATRGGGYHTVPHYHDAEQINYILAGEIWFFVEGHGYRCRKGDFMRIPRNKTHWAWNRTDQECTVLEVHTPPLINSRHRDMVVALLGQDEDPLQVTIRDNQWPSYMEDEMLKIEARAVEEEGDDHI